MADGCLVKCGSLPEASAQVAELRALTAACNAAVGYKLNIYTDSRYAFGVVHDYLSLWVSRGFLTSEGSPIRHGEVILNLHTAIQQPKEVAVLKVKAHTKNQDEHSIENVHADNLAGEAALNGEVDICKIGVINEQLSQTTQSLKSLEDLKNIHRSALKLEKWKWMENEGKMDDEDIWHGPENQYVLPTMLMGTMIQQYYSLAHDGSCRTFEKMNKT